MLSKPLLFDVYFPFVFEKQRLYVKLLGFFTKKGKTFLAKKRILEIFILLRQEDLQLHPLLAIYEALDFLKPFLVVVKNQTNKTNVPFEISQSRQEFFAFYWLIFSARKQVRLKGLSFSFFFCKDICQLLSKQNSMSIKFKQQNIQKNIQNKSKIIWRNFLLPKKTAIQNVKSVQKNDLVIFFWKNLKVLQNFLRFFVLARSQNGFVFGCKPNYASSILALALRNFF